MRQASSIGLRGEMDFLRRHNNRDITRQKRIRLIKVKGLHLGIICGILCLIGASIFFAARFVLTWENLNVKTIKIINSPKTGKEKIRQLTAYLNGNILSLSFEYLRNELLKINEVKDVSLSRILPSTIEIHFVLRKPVCQIYTAYRYHILDIEGVSLYTSKTKQGDLMTIKGIGKDEFENMTPFLPELIKIQDSLDYIGFNKPYGVVIKLKGLDEEFYPGESRYAEKINTFLKIRKSLALAKANIKKVDLRFDNRFYLEFDKEVIN
jgi:cell division septal protein FtsQ